MRSIVKPALILFIICLVVSAALAVTYSFTKDSMDERAKLNAESARKEVMADADSFRQVDIDAIVKDKPELGIVKEAYEGMKGSTPLGYVFLVESKGYGGAIKITVGVDNRGTTTGVKIGDNNETPGLGTKASDSSFKSQLVNITPSGPLKVVKGNKAKQEEIQAISGATITSRAVVKAVQAAIDMSAELKAEGGKK